MRGLLCARLCVLEAGGTKTDEASSCPCESLRETQTHKGASIRGAFKAGNCCTERSGITSTQDWGKQGSLHGGDSPSRRAWTRTQNPLPLMMSHPPPHLHTRATLIHRNNSPARCSRMMGNGLMRSLAERRRVSGCSDRRTLSKWPCR